MKARKSSESGSFPMATEARAGRGGCHRAGPSLRSCRSVIEAGIVISSPKTMRRSLVLLFAAVVLAACRKTPPAETHEQLTFVGNAAYPAISPDGHQLAYAITHCEGGSCSYSIEVQELGSRSTREVASGIAQLYYIRWSPDSRKLMYAGVARDGWASYLVAAAGGTARRVAVQNAVFSDSGEILWAPEQGSGAEHSIEIGGEEGVARTHIRIPGQADGFGVLCSVPASRWIVAALFHGGDAELRAVDRSGRLAGAFTVRGLGAGFTTASRDALWIQTTAADSAATLRVPFDPATGQFKAKGDVVYAGNTAGSPTIFGVTPAGDALVVAEASTTWAAFALSLDEAMRSGLADHAPLVRSTNAPVILRLSPDGRRLLLHSRSSHQWTIAPFSGQPETVLEPAVGDTVEDAFRVTASTIRLKERTRDALQLSILDTETRRRRAVLSLPADTAIGDFAALSDGSWAWISTWSPTVSLQRPGEMTDRQLPVPGIFATLSMDTDPDGSRLAVSGWMEPAATGAIGVSVIPLKPGGGPSIWWSSTHNDDPARVLWAGDRGLILATYEAPKATAIFNLRGPGDAQRLGTIPEDVADVFISRDLRRAALVSNSFHSDIWLHSTTPSAIPPPSTAPR